MTHSVRAHQSFRWIGLGAGHEGSVVVPAAGVVVGVHVGVGVGMVGRVRVGVAVVTPGVSLRLSLHPAIIHYIAINLEI